MNEYQWLDDTTPLMQLIHYVSRNDYLEDFVPFRDERVTRLFCCASAHRLFTPPVNRLCREAVESAEWRADHFRNIADVRAYYQLLRQHLREDPDLQEWEAPAYVNHQAAIACVHPLVSLRAFYLPGVSIAPLLPVFRDIVPYPHALPYPLFPEQRTPQVEKLATVAYEDRPSDDGTLDPARLAILADALEEIGCWEEELLRHLRGQERCPDCIALHRGIGKFLAGASSVRLAGAEATVASATISCGRCRDGWIHLRGPHVAGCWALRTVLGKE